MGLFSNLFGKSEDPGDEPGVYLTARLNARLQPVDRGDAFEDPLDNFLRERSWGKVTGGGTQLSDDGGIAFCDLEIAVNENNAEIMSAICRHLEELGAPKGSRLLIDGDDDGMHFGITEGFAFHFNNTQIDRDIQHKFQVSDVCEAMQEELGEDCTLFGYWNGQEETSVYFYGPSFESFRDRLAVITAQNPRCQFGRIEQIA